MGVVFGQAWSESLWTVLMGYLTISRNVRRYQTHHRWHFFLSGRQCIGAHALCVQHSLTAVALSISFLLNHAPQQPWAARIITRFRQSYSSVIMSREWKTLKKSRSDWLDCTDTAVEWKMRLLCFPVLPGSAEARVIWGGTIKHVLIACFISVTFLPKNIKMRSRVSKL